MGIITLKERSATALKERIEALSRVMPSLAEIARRYGGNFWLFGSAARGDMRADSDIDLLADFPIGVEYRAVGAAEAVCAAAGLPCDVIEKRTCSAFFLETVAPDLQEI